MSRQVTDDLGRKLALPDTPLRVVSLVPSISELVCALGRADLLVGVTRFCTHPPEIVAKLPRLGGTKNPDCAEIAALRPDLVLVNAEENRREDFEQLTTMGIAVFASFPRTVVEAAASVERIGAALDSEAAIRLAEEILAARATVIDAVRRRKRVFCPVWRKPFMSINRDTYVHDLLDCAGGDNVCANASERYPTVSLADVSRAQPEVLLLPDEPYHFRPRDLVHLEPLTASAFAATRVHFVDGRALSWYGPRTPVALSYFQSLIQS